MEVYIDERKKYILDELDSYGKISVSNMSEKLKVTTETIRRDLDYLESKNRLKRIHGGAIKISFDRKEPDHIIREKIYKLEKKKIGKKAASLINDNDVIFIDTGTTTCEVLYSLDKKKNISVILNNVASLNILIDLKNKGLFDGNIIFLGGQIDSNQLSCFGPVSENILDNFYFDKAFIAVGGIDIKKGLTGYNVQEANLSRKIMENSKEVIVLADHSKIGVRNFYRISSLSNVNFIISDEYHPEKWKESLDICGVNWIQA